MPTNFSFPNCFIMSAGMGTRMGEIGKILPKVLWPIFEKKIIDLQVDFAKDLGAERIFINTHHEAEKVSRHCSQNKLPVNILHEPILLGSGGGIHHLVSTMGSGAEGPLLILNADQFLFFPERYWQMALNNFAHYHVVLFAIKVDPVQKYNRLVVEQRTLVDIIKTPECMETYLTYSGVGIVNINRLKLVNGVSSFFDTVADYRKNRVMVIELEDYSYWDFGTSARYLENSFQILNHIKNGQMNPMLEFLQKTQGLRTDKFNVDKFSYGELAPPNQINLSGRPAQTHTNLPTIVLETAKEINVDKCGIYYFDHFNQYQPLPGYSSP
jgi:NDP-sugar pyrophosphorylase family protein